MKNSKNAIETRYVVCEITAPDGIVYRKRFLPERAPVSCIVVKTMAGEWHTFRWTSRPVYAVKRAAKLERRQLNVNFLAVQIVPVVRHHMTVKPVRPMFRDDRSSLRELTL